MAEGRIREALRLVSANVDTKRPLAIIFALREAVASGELAPGRARKAEKMICYYHATGDNWFNELLEIMDDRVKTRPTLW